MFILTKDMILSYQENKILSRNGDLMLYPLKVSNKFQLYVISNMHMIYLCTLNNYKIVFRDMRIINNTIEIRVNPSVVINIDHTIILRHRIYKEIRIEIDPQLIDLGV